MKVTVFNSLLNAQKLDHLHARKNAIFNSLPSADDFRLARLELFDLLTQIDRMQHFHFEEKAIPPLGLPQIG